MRHAAKPTLGQMRRGGDVKVPSVGLRATVLVAALGHSDGDCSVERTRRNGPSSAADA